VKIFVSDRSNTEEPAHEASTGRGSAVLHPQFPLARHRLGSPAALRSGTRLSRLRYPCQQAAAGTGSLWLSAFVFPGILRGLRAIGLSLPMVPLKKRDRNLLFAGVIVLAVVLLLLSHTHRRPAVPAPVRSSLPVWTSARPVQSHVFVVDSILVPDSLGTYNEGLDTLLSLLAQNGAYLYRSGKGLPWCDTTGIIGKNDVVLLKVNAEWDQRECPARTCSKVSSPGSLPTPTLSPAK
jgi:hypothetical protein